MQRAAPAVPRVSVILPVRNGEATIAAALDSVLAQDYAGAVEIVVADGSDTPATAEIIRRDYPEVRLIANPEQQTAVGIRAATRHATGDIVARCDAHTFWRRGYLRRAVETLQRTGAAVVGGRQRPVGRTRFERAVAIGMTSVLGAGGARYRRGGAEGSVETVYLGVFHRDAIDAVGGVNRDLVRGEDYDIYCRLRERGETVWFDPELVTDYRPRGSLCKLASQFFDYGRWKRYVLRLHPGRALPRHRAAALLTAALAVSPGLWLIGGFRAALLCPGVYLACLLVGSLLVGIRRRAPVAILLPLILMTMHLSWGAGFFLPPRIGHARDRVPEPVGSGGSPP